MADQPFLPFDEPPAAAPHVRREPSRPHPRPQPPETARPPADGEDSPPSPSSLIASLARACTEFPLAEKILIAPSLAVGHQIVERFARTGHRAVHLRVETVRTLAHAIAGPELAKEGRKLLSRAQALALIEQACGEVLSRDSYFGALRNRPGLHRALQNVLDELRAAGLSPGDLPAGAFADPRKLRELNAIRERYEQSLLTSRWIDRAEVLRRAADRVTAGVPASTGAIYLLAFDGELSVMERRFLEGLSGGGVRSLGGDDSREWTSRARDARFVRALGEENEIRNAFRALLAEGRAYDDSEILYTDASIYPALVFELAAEYEIPCTFSGGISASYARPGRAALAFLAWIGSGYEAEILRQALASGQLEPRTGNQTGFLAIARILREAEIGWGRARHLTVLDRLVAELSSSAPSREDETPDDRDVREQRRIRRLAETREARSFLESVISLVPDAPEFPLGTLASAARQFLARFSRTTNELDGVAGSALATLFSQFEALEGPPLARDEAVRRLSDAVRALHVAADRPRPGRLHVADLRAGGHAGRRSTWILGLDERRHPGRGGDDPVLSDAERRRINEETGLGLALGRSRSERESEAVRACIARLPGELTLSYSGWNVRALVQAGEVFPSPFVLEAFRQGPERGEAEFEDLARATAPPAGFVPPSGRDLDDGEWWLSRIEAVGFRGSEAQAVVLAFHSSLAEGARAEIARDSTDFTVWDGSVGEPTPELDPRVSRKPMSSSRLRNLAECPYRHFLGEILGIASPQEPDRDPTRWLEPLALGKLMHEIFHRFHQALAREGLKPRLDRDVGRIEAIAEEEIRTWRDRIPPRSELAFRGAREEILFACRTFVRLEETHCRDVTPRFFELAFGLPRSISGQSLASDDPVEISLGPGRSFLLRGSIDRVDEDADGNFHVWDYKTGGTFSIKEDQTLRGGRQMQHALYSLALEALLARAGCGGSVVRAGYFFPGRKGQGQRMEVPDAPDETRKTLNGLFDLVAAGQFPHSPEDSDCNFCDFREVCGDVKREAARSDSKLEASADPHLRFLLKRND